MKQITVNPKTRFLLAFFTLCLALHLFFPSPALTENPLLIKIIIAYNLKTQKESLINDSYRGEEGILRIKPEAGKALGMEVLIDQDYLDSMGLFKKADRLLKKARKAMVSQKEEKSPGEHAKEIADYFLLYKETLEFAKQKLMAYRSRLSLSVDDRLNRAISARVMDRLLEGSLKKNDNILRDALGHFYNKCQGLNQSDHSLTPENIRFVNEVFRQFIQQASGKILDVFNLDRDCDRENKKILDNWKRVIEKECSQYVSLVEAATKRYEEKGYAVDPLLFIALMKRESRFDRLAVSRVGAAGLTQIMPKTAMNLGMTNIYMPAYFNEARSLLMDERKNRRQAMAILFQINEKNRLKYAAEARELMQKSLTLARKKKRLFSRYRKELLQKGTDARFQPAQAIEYGLKYFAGLMKEQKGDISLALASYNAGPHRVREFQGIPPYTETVLFRNRVLEYYRGYLKKAEEAI